MEKRLPQATDILASIKEPVQGLKTPPKPSIPYKSNQPYKPERKNYPQKRTFRPPNPNKRISRDWNLFCETCDRDFNSLEQLTAHKSEHQICGIDGCKFVGHKIVVQKHVQSQHNSGLYDRLKKLETPEDIAKWKDERKRNFPSRANIELKQQLEVEKSKRGERLDDPNERFPNKKNRNQSKNKRKRNRKGNNRPNYEKEAEIAKEKVDEEVEEILTINQGVARFKGTSELKDFTPKLSQNTNSLTQLLDCYGSDTDEEEEEIVKIKPENESLNDISGKEMELESSPAIDPNLKVNSISDTRQNNRNRKRENGQTAKSDSPPTKKVLKSGLNLKLANQRPPNTLLWKLLQSEIRHERNVLLQAVRFTVENNFFDNNKL